MESPAGKMPQGSAWTANLQTPLVPEKGSLEQPHELRRPARFPAL